MIRERTLAGLERVKREGKTLGRDVRPAERKADLLRACLAKRRPRHVGQSLHAARPNRFSTE